MKSKKEKSSPKKPKGNGFAVLRAGKDVGSSYKTLALLSSKIVPEESDLNEVAQQISEKFEAIPGNRPIAKKGPSADTPQKRPVSVTSPGGSEYKREKDYGFCLFYSNKTVKEVSRNIPDAIPEEVLQTLQDPLKKREEITITPELIEKMVKARKKGLKRGTNGIPTQNSVMAREGVDPSEASANKIATALGVSEEGEAWELLHLILFMLRGRSAQTPSNLTIGTFHANTDMIFGEDSAIYLGSMLEKGVHLIVEAEEVPNSHLATLIKYTIVMEKSEICFLFDPLTSVQPNIRNRDYIRAVMEVLVEASKPKSLKRLEFDAKSEKLPASDMPLLFFNSTQEARKPKISKTDPPKDDISKSLSS